MNNCQQQSLETGKAQRYVEDIRESVIADGGLACCPQPWKGHLEEAFAAIDRLQMRISLYETKLSRTNSESMEFPVAKRSRNSDSNLDMPSSCFRRSSFNLVFRSLADSIEAWEAAGDTKTRHLLPKFNIVATVVKWGVPNQTKGMVTVFDFSTALSCCQGSDCHVLATISDSGRTIKASFFFDREKIVKAPDAGDRVRLIGVQIQEWAGQYQLCGKNVQLGEPVVIMSLSDAVAAWSVVKAAGALKYFPKLTTVVSVVAWGDATTSRGVQQRTWSLFPPQRAHATSQAAICIFQLSFLMQIAPSRPHYFLTHSIVYPILLPELPTNSSV